MGVLWCVYAVQGTACAQPLLRNELSDGQQRPGQSNVAAADACPCPSAIAFGACELSGFVCSLVSLPCAFHCVSAFGPRPRDGWAGLIEHRALEDEAGRGSPDQPVLRSLLRYAFVWKGVLALGVTGVLAQCILVRLFAAHAAAEECS